MRLSCLFLPWDLGGFSFEFWLCLDAEAKANDELSPWLDFWVALKFPRKAIPAKILGAVRGYKTKWYWMDLPECFMRLSYTILLDNYHFVMNPEEEVECSSRAETIRADKVVLNLNDFHFWGTVGTVLDALQMRGTQGSRFSFGGSRRANWGITSLRGKAPTYNPREPVGRVLV